MFIKRMLEAGLIVRTLFIAPIEHAPYTTIHRGEWGTAGDWTEWSFQIELDKFHPGLVRWNNKLLITTDLHETILHKIKFFPIEPVPRAHWFRENGMILHS